MDYVKQRIAVYLVKLSSAAINFLYPPTCIISGFPGYNNLDISKIWYDELVLNNHFCPQCGISVLSIQYQQLCKQCLFEPPFFDHTIAPFLFVNPMEYLIHRFKFNKHLASGRLLSSLLSEKLLLCGLPKIDCLVPVPLHNKRLRERGFNQSLLIAKDISKQLSIPLNNSLIKRVKPTAAQAKLVAKARKKNVKNAFQFIGKNCPESVAIVDDVMTTGSTVNECAKVLKNAGVKQITVLVVARVSIN